MKKLSTILIIVSLTLQISYSCREDDSVETKLTDIDGNEYRIVKINNQIWMAENLKVTHYADGASIPFINNISGWTDLNDNDTDKAYCYYNNDVNDSYGVLYSWAAATNGEGSLTNPSNVQGACPNDWHLPSVAEWTELIDYLGGKEVAGGKMKQTGTIYWLNPNTGATNESGFSALGAGYIDGSDNSPSEFQNRNYFGYWWTATKESESKAKEVLLLYNDVLAEIGVYNMSSGNCVRCIKDE